MEVCPLLSLSFLFLACVADAWKQNGRKKGPSAGGERDLQNPPPSRIPWRAPFVFVPILHVLRSALGKDTK